MPNHHVNMMEGEPAWQLLYTNEGRHNVLNSGLVSMKGSDVSFWVYEEAIKVRSEDRGHLARSFAHEQGAIVKVYERNKLFEQIKIIKHRHGRLDLNAFARQAAQDGPEMICQPGDAFVHYLGGMHEASGSVW